MQKEIFWKKRKGESTFVAPFKGLKASVQRLRPVEFSDWLKNGTLAADLQGAFFLKFFYSWKKFTFPAGP